MLLKAAWFPFTALISPERIGQKSPVMLPTVRKWIFEFNFIIWSKDPDVIDDIFGLMSQCAADNPKLIMSQFDAKGENFGWDCAMLIIFFLVLRLIAYLALKVKVRQQLLVFVKTFISSSRYTTTICWRTLVTSSNNSSTRASELLSAATGRDLPAAASSKSAS